MNKTEKYNCNELISLPNNCKFLVKSGVIWLTYFNESEDFLLFPGDWHEINQTKKPVIQTLKESEIDFQASDQS